MFLGDGQGGFAQQETSRISGLDADLNADGFVDGVSGTSVLIGVELGNADGEADAFGIFASQGHPNAAFMAEECIGDFDGDGRPDLAMVNGCFISILINAFQGAQ